MNPLIYGKSDLNRIVSIEPGNGQAEVFRELEDGTVVSSKVPCSHYILFSEQHSPKMRRLAGNQYYNHIMEYDEVVKFQDVLSASYKKRLPLHVIRDPKEALMCKDGYTHFKGMKVEDISVLSFDIETTGLVHDSTSKVLLISNTFRRKGKIEKMLFALDDFNGDQKDMLRRWVEWVHQCNPSVIVGHNLYGFDLPYLAHVARMVNIGLLLGRDDSPIRFNHRTSQFRKDGSQSYDYTNAYIYGREIVDTQFLAMKYDTAARREYENYKLKDIITHEKLEKKGRVFYDASKIRENWHILAEREKIKKYAIDDADDALALYDLMIPSFFYYTQAIPRGLQSIINTATGSQINSWMVRSYLQTGHSIALASEAADYEGAISFGVPGIHKNVFKIDVQSLYPSIIIGKGLYNKAKDPAANFLAFMEFFTAQRIKDKEEYERTGDRLFSDLSDSRKININSGYGFLGAGKLNYNSPADAATVTAVGRDLFKQAILYASGREYVPALEEIEVEDVA